MPRSASALPGKVVPQTTGPRKRREGLKKDIPTKSKTQPAGKRPTTQVEVHAEDDEVIEDMQHLFDDGISTQAATNQPDDVVDPAGKGSGNVSTKSRAGAADDDGVADGAGATTGGSGGIGKTNQTGRATRQEQLERGRVFQYADDSEDEQDDDDTDSDEVQIGEDKSDSDKENSETTLESARIGKLENQLSRVVTCLNVLIDQVETLNQREREKETTEDQPCKEPAAVLTKKSIKQTREQPTAPVQSDSIQSDSSLIEPVQKESVQRDFIKLPTYDGESELEIFLNLIITCKRHNRWSELQTRGHVEAALRGKAAKVLMTSGHSIQSLEDLLDALKQRFGSEGQCPKYRDLLRTRRRQEGESLADLYSDISKLGMLAYAEANSKLAEELITEAFCSSIGGELESKVRDREPTNLTDAYRYAVRIEARQPQLKQLSTSRKKNEGQCAFALKVDSDGDETGSHPRCNQNHPDAQSTARINALEEKIAALTKKEAQRPKKSFKPNSRGYQNGNRNTARVNATGVADRNRPFTCYFCDQPGHMKRDCELWKVQQTVGSGTAVPAQHANSATAGQTRPPVKYRHNLLQVWRTWSLCDSMHV